MQQIKNEKINLDIYKNEIIEKKENEEKNIINIFKKFDYYFNNCFFCCNINTYDYKFNELKNDLFKVCNDLLNII